jgi:hypothetical protein
MFLIIAPNGYHHIKYLIGKSLQKKARDYKKYLSVRNESYLK